MTRIRPQLGLVCITCSNRCRFRTITRTQFLKLSRPGRIATLEELYWDNLNRLHGVLSFCAHHDIRLYRMTSSLFPMSDEPLGEQVLRGFGALLSSVGRRAERLGIRMVMHPDQFVVLSSTSRQVVRTSIRILCKQALAMDLMGLPRSPWSTIILHGGKAGRGRHLVRTIQKLPDEIRSRLSLENDERAYSAAEILDVCRQAGVPMVFDNLHHAVREKLSSYDDPSIRRFVEAARATWPRPQWQLVHLSNGLESFCDARHSRLIAQVPPAYSDVPWIEVEAKGKEEAIFALRRGNGTAGSSQAPVSPEPARRTARPRTRPTGRAR